MNIIKEKELHPNAKVLVHRECTPEVAELADEVLSTEGMNRYVKDSQHDEFIIGTEIGMIYRLEKNNPGKSFYAATRYAVCPNMKLTTLEKVLWSLEDLTFEIILDQDIISRANESIQKMINFRE